MREKEREGERAPRLDCRVGDRKPYLPTVFGRHSTTPKRERGSEEKEKTDRSRTRHILRRSFTDTLTVHTSGSFRDNICAIFCGNIMYEKFAKNEAKKGCFKNQRKWLYRTKVAMHYYYSILICNAHFVDQHVWSGFVAIKKKKKNYILSFPFL